MVRGEQILVAAGRRPQTQDLDLETVDLQPGQPLEVTDSLAVPGLPCLMRSDARRAEPSANPRTPRYPRAQRQGANPAESPRA